MKDIKRYLRIADMRYNDKMTLQAIGNEEGLTRERVRQILSEGRVLDPALAKARTEHEREQAAIRNGERARKIAELHYVQGLSDKAIAKRLGLTRQRVWQIRKQFERESAEEMKELEAELRALSTA